METHTLLPAYQLGEQDPSASSTSAENWKQADSRKAAPVKKKKKSFPATDYSNNPVASTSRSPTPLLSVIPLQLHHQHNF